MKDDGGRIREMKDDRDRSQTKEGNKK